MIAYVVIVAAGAALTGAGITILLLLRRCATLSNDVRVLGRLLAELSDTRR